MYAWTALIAFSAVAVALVPWPVAAVVFLAGLAGLAFLVSRPAAALSRR
jgi:chromate transport protein ChrA